VKAAQADLKAEAAEIEKEKLKPASALPKTKSSSPNGAPSATRCGPA
jgi:hypothetical protein